MLNINRSMMRLDKPDLSYIYNTVYKRLAQREPGSCAVP